MTLDSAPSRSHCHCSLAQGLTRLVVFGNPAKAIRRPLEALANWARAKGVECAVDRRTWEALDEEARARFQSHCEVFESDEAADQTAAPGALLVTLGGDGTMIHAIHLFRPFMAPVMGINLGSLGFNASVEACHLEAALEACHESRARCSERMLLEVAWRRDGVTIDTALAINDVVLAKKTKGHTVRLRLSQGVDVVSAYEADGLIVASPTGSTAYNLSAGGPIVHPSLKAMVVTAICPHTLAARPAVLPPEPPLRVESEPGENLDRASVWIDGREPWEVCDSDWIEIKAAKCSVRIIDSLETQYFSTLRRKFNWSGELPEPKRKDDVS